MGLSRSTTRQPLAAFDRLGSVDPLLLFVSLALSAYGIFAVYIAATDARVVFALNQGIGFVVGATGAVVLALLDYRFLQKYLRFVYGGVIVMLIAVPLIGVAAGGAQRWVNVGPIQVQPSEFAKLGMVIVLAGFLAEKPANEGRTFLAALGVIGVPAVLVFLQPDLGTALVFGAMFFTMAFIAGARIWHLGALAALGAGIFALAVKLTLLEPYQVARMTTFLNPSASTALSYQVEQSKMAIGSGGFTGKGINATTLSNLGFLPEEQTDFIFSNLSERVGFLGSMLLLGLFLLLIWRILHVATISRDRFGVLLAVGIATIFIFHVFVNVGMTMGIMPVTGIPLPFVSYGRSSLVVSVASLGLLQSVAARARQETSKHPRP